MGFPVFEDVRSYSIWRKEILVRPKIAFLPRFAPVPGRSAGIETVAPGGVKGQIGGYDFVVTACAN